MKNVAEIAGILADYCADRKFVEAYQELFHEDAISIDPLNPETGQLNGLDTLIAAERRFLERATLHRFDVSEPQIAGNFFSVVFSMDATVGGNEISVDEIAVYGVRDGKIVSQQFFAGKA